MLMIAVSGLVAGILISAPLGPMAALASLEVSRKRWPAALSVASGVCLGDALLAGVVVAFLQTPVKLEMPEGLPELLGGTVLLALAGVIWKDAGKPVPPAKVQSFWRAVIATVAHPGNIIGFAMLYAGLVQTLAGRAVAGLNPVENSLLLAATLVGMMLGWALVLGIVQLAVRRFGRIPVRLQASLARAISLFMVVSAFALLATGW